MAEITCFLALLMGLRSHKTCNQGNKYRKMCRTILCINPIQPWMIWTVNCLGGLCDPPPPVYLDNYATYRYLKLHTNRQKLFSF